MIEEDLIINYLNKELRYLYWLLNILFFLLIQNAYAINLVLDIGHTPKQSGATSSNCQKNIHITKN